MLTSAGILSALDSRTPVRNNSGLGDLLQAANYIGGVSGGSWLVVATLINDFKPMMDLISQELNQSSDRLLPGVPDFDPGFKGNWLVPLVRPEIPKEGPILTFIKKLFTFDFGVEPARLINKREEDIQSSPVVEESLESIIKFYQLIHFDIAAKKRAGSYISLTDYWGRILSRKIFGSAASFSSVVDTESFSTYQHPFPILSSIQKTPKTSGSSLDSHLVELTPYEFGSWDSYINGFASMRYLGTRYSNGAPEGECRENYDNIGFIAAISSSLFNKVFLNIYNRLTNIDPEAQTAISTLLRTFGLSASNKNPSFPQQHPDYAIVSPNPFFQYLQADSEIQEGQHLYLADGGDDGQNIGYQPFLQPYRNIDIVLSYDMSSDIFNFPNGTSLQQSELRFHNLQPRFDLPSFQLQQFKKSVFPYVPSVEETLKSGLFDSPVFLGCDIVSDYPVLDQDQELKNTVPDYLPPLIVYHANRYITFPSNQSTFKLSYSEKELLGMVNNGYNIATHSNSSDFAACLSCALIKRLLDKAHFAARNESSPIEPIQVPEFCHQCYNQYCWHRQTNTPTSNHLSFHDFKPRWDLKPMSRARGKSQTRRSE